MVVRNKYGGYWNKTRSTVDSGGLSIPCMISITNIFQPTESPLILPCHAIPDITVPTETGDKRMPTQGRGFPGFLPVCMQGTWGWLSSQVWSFPTSWKSPMCNHANDHITWNNNSPKWGGVIKVSMNIQKYHAGVQNACLQVKGRQCAFQTLEIFLLASKSYFKQIWINTQIQKQHKKLFEFFFK